MHQKKFKKIYVVIFKIFFLKFFNNENVLFDKVYYTISKLKCVKYLYFLRLKKGFSKEKRLF